VATVYGYNGALAAVFISGVIFSDTVIRTA
jgi:hypothetical protein